MNKAMSKHYLQSKHSCNTVIMDNKYQNKLNYLPINEVPMITTFFSVTKETAENIDI